MTLSAVLEFHATSVPDSQKSGKTLEHRFLENGKAKTKSKATFHLLEFLTRVFSSEGASRFFKTFLLRFMFEKSNKTPDDSLRRLTSVCAY
jgi:hypothetical protein